MCGLRCLMGKRINIYFGEGYVLDKFQKQENKSDLISKLLSDYYNKDLEYLKQKEQDLTEQLSIIKMRISNILESREKIKQEQNKISELKEEATRRKEFNNKLTNLWRIEKITDEIYYKICDMKDLNEKEIELSKYVNF